MEIEWKNGDECVYKHQPDVTYMFVGMHPVNSRSAVCWNEKEGIAQIHIDFISKPETPQQREERERLEAAYDLYCIMCGIEGYAKFDLIDFSKTKKDSAVWLAIVDKTNYRK
ncbi:hypothetical protein VPHF89G1_0004 [Vibrio phage F89 g1]